MEKLKKRWGIESNFQIIIILIVFSITGSSSLFVGKPILEFFNINNEMGWLYWPLRLIVIFPAYQVLLVLYGWLFGQFRFFWNFEKKMLSHLGLKFLFKEKDEER